MERLYGNKNFIIYKQLNGTLLLQRNHYLPMCCHWIDKKRIKTWKPTLHRYLDPCSRDQVFSIKMLCRQNDWKWYLKVYCSLTFNVQRKSDWRFCWKLNVLQSLINDTSLVFSFISSSFWKCIIIFVYCFSPQCCPLLWN